MKTVFIKFPQITVDFKAVKVSDEEYDEIINGDADKSKFIYDNLTEQEQNWLPNGQKGLESALEWDLASIKNTLNTIEP